MALAALSSLPTPAQASPPHPKRETIVGRPLRPPPGQGTVKGRKSLFSRRAEPNANGLGTPGPSDREEATRPGKRAWERSWNAHDVGTAAVLSATHALCLFAPSTFSWGAFWTTGGLYLTTGLLGITLSFHRNLAHRSFRLPKWLEYTFAYMGVHALQGDPLSWVSTHRHHHQHCDTDGDPHSPIEGFWFSHMTWLLDSGSLARKCGERDNVGDLEKQPFYRFLRQTYILHPAAMAILLYNLGGFPYLVWGMGVRVVWVHHITWFVNSACHIWGRQAWNTGDLSRNNWWVALLAFGEGWHNNHHAFEYSARHGLEWWQIDVTWYVVRLLQALSLATQVRLPTRAHMEQMRLRPSRWRRSPISYTTVESQPRPVSARSDAS